VATSIPLRVLADAKAAGLQVLLCAGCGHAWPGAKVRKCPKCGGRDVGVQLANGLAA